MEEQGEYKEEDKRSARKELGENQKRMDQGRGKNE